jgi:flavin-dependent dehydrogenase
VGTYEEGHLQPINSHDVVVMGGGLAGLTLAVQLKRRVPSARILVAERNEHPPPPMAHKVGESTIEGAAHYYGTVLGLREYLETQQLLKPGLRFYYSDHRNDDIARRLELGDSSWPTWHTYQLDRGTFEAKLACYAQEHGVEFVDRCTVRDVRLGDDEHTVVLARDGAQQELRTRWVVDATGRAALLKRKLKLALPVRHKINAAWFRIGEKLDIGSWSQEPDWQARVDEQDYRWLSTNHLMGPGYWVWLIPLAGEATSVGIVADERWHPLSEMNSFEKAMDWLRVNEPQCHAAVESHRDRLMDFRLIKHFSLGCQRVYSPERWCVTGVAGAFHDALFSPGSDVIGYSNTYVTDLIGRELEDEDVHGLADLYNDFYLNYIVAPLFHIYEEKYALMGNAQLFSAYVQWNSYWYWSIMCLLFFQDKLADLDFMESIKPEIDRYILLVERIQPMFVAWTALDPGSTRTDYYINEEKQDHLSRLHDDLGGQWTDEELRAKVRANLADLEDLAAEMFWRAVQVLPDPPEYRPIDPYAISLDPSRWQVDGLFDASQREGRPRLDWDRELGDLWFERRYAACGR